MVAYFAAGRLAVSCCLLLWVSMLKCRVAVVLATPKPISRIVHQKWSHRACSCVCSAWANFWLELLLVFAELLQERFFLTEETCLFPQKGHHIVIFTPPVRS